MECTTFVAEMQVPEAGEPVAVQNVYQALLDVSDRRVKRGNAIVQPWY